MPRSAATHLLALLVTAALAAGSAQDPTVTHLLPEIRPASVSVRLERVADGLALPVALLPIAPGDPRLLVTQLEGTVVVVEGDWVRPEPFLDLRHRVSALVGEQGLFSVALEGEEPARARGDRPRLVAAFTEIGSGDLVVAAFDTLPGLGRADAASEVELLRVAMPEPFHHGGQVAFGPDDMLYVGIGDGEAANRFLLERPHASQALDTLRGTVVRLDPFPAGSDEAPYRVPEDNPFVGLERGRFGETVRAEVWAFGFRNPWKFTFHPDDGAIYLADVGNDRWEEINRVEPGRDHGWPAREGPECQLLPESGELVDPDCPETAYVDPVVAYAHPELDPGGGRAVVGGVFVADPALPGLHGRYLFGDYVTGRLWSWDPTTGTIELLLETGLALTAIAAGPSDEVLVLGIEGVMARLLQVD